MMDAELFRNILFSLSGLSFGSAGYALIRHAIHWREKKLDHTGFMLVKVGWLMTVGMVFQTILVPLSAVPPTWQGYVYMVGLATGAAGMVIVARVGVKKH